MTCKSNEKLYVSIFDDEALDPKNVGGKGYGLARVERAIRPLREEGLPVSVPPALILTPKFTSLLFSINPKLNELVEKLDKMIEENRPYADETKEIRDIILSTKLNDLMKCNIDSIIEDITKMLNDMGKTDNLRVAVRSSGLAEDLPGASFAGQYATVLNVHLNTEELFNAILECAASVWGDRVVDYRAKNRKKGLPIPTETEILNSGAFTVVVQAMIDSQWSGVGFSIDSETGHPNIIKFNIIRGLGELGVQGVVPTVEGWGAHKSDQIEMSFGELKIKTAANALGLMPPKSRQKKKLVYVPGEGNKVVPVTDDDPKIITRSQAELIAYTIHKLSETYNQAIDVEFCWEQGMLYIVQMRPETVHAPKKEAIIESYILKEEPKPESLLAVGLNVGTKIARGPLLPVKFETDPSNLPRLIRYMKRILEGFAEKGIKPILYTDMTSPPWEPVMNGDLVSGICTEEGNRTSHPAIVCREAGIASGVGMKVPPEELEKLETKMIGVTCRECGHTWYLDKGDEDEIREAGQCPVCGGRLFTLRILQESTLDCSTGEARLYSQALEFEVKRIKIEKLPKTVTKVGVNCGSPPESLQISQIPGAEKVGLAREEFISAWINMHPKFALIADKYKNGDGWLAPDVEELFRGIRSLKEEWIERLELGVGMEAAAFYPREIILRTSDFKTNEYETLLGATYYDFRCPVHGYGIGLRRLERCPICGSSLISREIRLEPKENNPMLGWRGAARYLDPEFQDAFDMELEAIIRVMRKYKNITLMIPFIRHPHEAKEVTAYIKEKFKKAGLKEPKIIFMAEVPSITLVPELFHEYTKGYSFGTNDLTQLVTGTGRDSSRLLFNENVPAVKKAISLLADSAHQVNPPKELGICGQAPSDIKEFIEFLTVYLDYISVNPDVVVSTIKEVAEIEKHLRELIAKCGTPKKLAKELTKKFGIDVSVERAKMLIEKLKE